MSIFQNLANWQHSRGYPGSVRGWKNKLRGLFDPVMLGQVRIAIKSSIIEPLGSPIHLLACFGQKFERTISERTTSSRHNEKNKPINKMQMWFGHWSIWLDNITHENIPYVITEDVIWSIWQTQLSIITIILT